MELIDKAAVVARIEEEIKEYSKAKKEYPTCEEYYEGALDILKDFRDNFLNTLEVKKVDLEEEGGYIDKVPEWLCNNIMSNILESDDYETDR